MRVLVVEDNAEVARQLKDTLERELFVVDVAGDGEKGWFMGDTEAYDAVILDLEDAENTTSEPPLPARFVLEGQSEERLVKVKAADPTQGFSFRLAYRLGMG